MKIFLIIVAAIAGTMVLFEISLRLLFGLGNPPLYIADEEIGYLLAPNQEVRRRGNQIKINQYSMRSEAIAPQKPAATTRILILGDSIVNGGWWTDQDDTLPALIERELITKKKNIEVLNASANSWAPRNELAYLRRFGLFEADALILVINTDDLFGTAPTSLPVGRERNYPATKPPLALIELYTQLWSKDKPIPELEKIKNEKGDRVGFNLAAIKEIKAIASNANIPFILTMTPLLRELEGNGSRDYELKARDRLKEFTITEQITYIDFLPAFQDFPQPEFLYRDHIHLSPQGNHLVSKTLVKFLQSIKS